MLFIFYLTYWHACHELKGYKDMGITPLTMIEIKFAWCSFHLNYHNGAFTYNVDCTKYNVLRVAVCSFKSCLLLKAPHWGLVLKINIVVPQYLFHQVAISCCLSVSTFFIAQLLNYKFEHLVKSIADISRYHQIGFDAPNCGIKLKRVSKSFFFLYYTTRLQGRPFKVQGHHFISWVQRFQFNSWISNYTN